MTHLRGFHARAKCHVVCITKTQSLATPDTATGPNPADTITDKRGYAARWHFSVRKIDDLLAKGLPHLAIGKRRVRICIAEADDWMQAQFRVQRIGKAGGVQ